MENAVGSRFSITEEPIRLLPPGYRFLPSDEEVFDYYLKKKNLDPDDNSVRHVEVIDPLKYEPWELLRLSGRQREDKDRCFFCSPESSGDSGNSGTKRTRDGKCYKQERFKRGTAAGRWESTGEVTVFEGLGFKRYLVFYKRVPGCENKKGMKTPYVMHEFVPIDFHFSKKPFVFIYLSKQRDNKWISKGKAPRSQLLASNFDNSVIEATFPQAGTQSPAQLEMYDGFDSINQKSISAMQLPNAPEEESLNDMLTVISSPDEGKLWQDISHSSGPVEGQPDHHQGQPSEDIIHSPGPIDSQPNHHLLALDSGHYNSGQKLKRLSYAKRLSSGGFNEGQLNQQLTFDSRDEAANSPGVQVDHHLLVQSGSSEPWNHPEYEPSNLKRFNNDIKSNNSQFENLVEKEDYFGGFEPPLDMGSPYSINVENYGDWLLYHPSMVKEYSLVSLMSENINPATL